jgi:hypothetical protein
MPRWAALLAILGLVLPLLAADDKADPKKEPDKNAKKEPDKAPDPKKDLDKHLNTEKTLKAGQVTGKIVAIVESKKSLRLQVELQIPQLNQGAAIGLQQDQINYARAAQARDLQGMINARNAMLQHQATLYNLHRVTKDVELQTTDDVKVRLSNPPAQFDDKGKIKKYTPKELAALKGPDPKLPGYNGEFSDLQQDQIVAVTLVKKKEAPRPAARPKGKDSDVELMLENLPQVSMIVVMYDPNANAGK